MQSAIVSLKNNLTRLFRTYVVDGTPETGLNEPNIEELRSVLGTQLPEILDRCLIGPTGDSYPEFPADTDLDGKLFYLNLAEERWDTILASTVQAAADLANMQVTIQDAVDAAAQAIIDGLSDSAPFDARFDDEATLTADLAFDADAFAIAMDTLRIFKKSGASGAGSWALHSSVLDSFAGTASAQDITDVNARVDTVEADLSDKEKRLARLERLSPAIAPIWEPVPDQNFEEATTGLLINFLPFITDPDTLGSDLVVTAVTALPAEMEIQNNTQLTATSGIQILAETTYTFRVTDESGNTADMDLPIEVFAIGNAPNQRPSFSTIPALSVVQGNAIPPRNYRDDVQDPDTNDTDLIFTQTVDAASGMILEVDGFTRGGAAGTPGTYTVTMRAQDLDGLEDETTYQFVVEAANGPDWSPIGPRVAVRNTSPVVFDYAQFLTDPNTPVQDLQLTISGAPGGTTVDGLVVTVPTATLGLFTITAEVTNNAGVSASIEHQVSIILINFNDPGLNLGGGGDGIIPF